MLNGRQGTGSDCRHSFAVERAPAGVDLLEIAAGSGVTAPLFYVERPAAGQALLGLGSAHVVRTAGPERLVAASHHALAVLDRCETASVVEAGIGPRFVGGFGFTEEDSTDASWREFPACRLVLPRELWIATEGTETRVVRSNACAAAGNCARPSEVRSPSRSTVNDVRVDDRGHWISRVEHVLGMVAAARLDKVVLSRRRMLFAPDYGNRGAIADLLARLRAARPGCYTFWIAAGQTHFIGSTPELLVRRAGSRLETQALAGTIARGRGPAGDAVQAQRLIGSAKNLREQQAVTAALADALAPVTSALWLDRKPSVLTLPEAHHLNSSIVGELSVPLSALELASRLHPTPAVCGWPRANAYELLATEEANRGWYSGGVGWLAAGGDGEFAVALRAALIDGPLITLWAGAGIVAGSDPSEEYDETETKMAALGAMLEVAEAISA